MDVKTLCLGVLMLGDASGYEIKKHFEEGPFAHFHAAGFGSIYPALDTLRRQGLVSCTEKSQTGRPDKKVYSITPEGRAALTRALHKPPANDAYRSDVLFMMFFSYLLDPNHLREIYDGYLARYRAHVERMARSELCNCTDGQQFVHGMGLAIYRAAVTYMEDNREALLGGPRQDSATHAAE